jgi:hypothetical protein
MMTVAELIEELNKLPQDMLVLVPGYEGGYDNIEVQRNGTVLLNDNWDGQEKLSWYNGRHSESYKSEEGDDLTPCVVIGRGK